MHLRSNFAMPTERNLVTIQRSFANARFWPIAKIGLKSNYKQIVCRSLTAEINVSVYDPKNRLENPSPCKPA